MYTVASNLFSIMDPIDDLAKDCGPLYENQLTVLNTTGIG